ncbi:Wzz/FepE/Etk N-terminal domain-containing protein [Vreelandella titanicae]|uniref:Polysaccharide chain length determinant N-terminal domain-containing protein n=1 Tax=Vreelandella titanicae TaxID=664683 RepID=A0A558J1S0_9GAMM|nr:Wzz/FepE/Etk N-terminal domain-containing protein [Halomonas titanicae]TVU87611.1 hypothetical protein FQP89_20915 [Halomonas titanicae]
MVIESHSQEEKSYEIDLREVALSILGAWYWVVGTVVLFVSLGLMYLWLVTPVYEARFRAAPAPASNFAIFNHFNDFEISPEDAYRALANRLTSFQNFESFIEENKGEFSLDNEASLIDLFQNRFTIDGLVEDRAGSMTLSIRYHYPEGENGDELLNSYVSETSRTVWSALHARFNAYNQAQLVRLNINVDLEQEGLRTEREEEIFEIENAITIARDLNIASPKMPYQLESQTQNSQFFYATDESLPKYFMGYEALESERDALLSSIDKGLSNEDIRDNQQSIDARQRISNSIDNSEMSASELDDFILTERVVDVIEYAFPGERTISPNKPLILALSIIIGGVLGLVIALISISFKNLRRR